MDKSSMHKARMLLLISSSVVYKSLQDIKATRARRIEYYEV